MTSANSIVSKNLKNINMKEFIAYQCSYCSKYGKQKSRIKDHEKTCFRNPDTKSCATCIHLKQKKYIVAGPEMGIPFNSGCVLTDSIPVCDEGVDVSNVTDGEKNVYLKTQCALWEPVIEEG
jgi:hypothetical protein